VLKGWNGLIRGVERRLRILSQNTVNNQCMIIIIWPALYSIVCVCLSVIKFCKQAISNTNLWIFAKFITDTPYMLA